MTNATTPTRPDAVTAALAELLVKGGSIQINLPDGGYVQLIHTDANEAKPYEILAQRKKGAHLSRHGTYAAFDIASLILPRIATVLNDYKEIIE